MREYGTIGAELVPDLDPDRRRRRACRTPTAPSAPSPRALAAGAENRDGTSGQNLTPVANGQFVVTTAGPTPGGSVTFGYTATGVTKGTYTLAAQLTSPLLRTTSIAPVAVTVTR